MERLADGREAGRERAAMKIERIDLKLVRLPLVRAFRTSSATKDHLDHTLVRVVADGLARWGESASPSDPYYCPETSETCWHILKDFLGPLVLGHDWDDVEGLTRLYRLVKGNRFAKAGLETACWDLVARRDGDGLEILAPVGEDAKLIEQAIRKTAA